MSVVTAVSADCSAGTNRSGRADARAVIAVDRKDSCSGNRLGQSQLAARRDQPVVFGHHDRCRDVDLTNPFV